MGKYIFPLAIQLVAPENPDEPEFNKTLKLLEELGFYGVELNITNFENHSPAEWKEQLAKYGLKFTRVASGVYAKKNGLNMSTDDEALRQKTIDDLLMMGRFAKELDAGVICGFVKGAAGGNKAEWSPRMRKTIELMNDGVKKIGAPMVIEAVCRFDTTCANSTTEAAKMIEGLDNPYFNILPDTYHMDIEEADPIYGLVKYKDLYSSIHISDNNRFFPGEGNLDFFHILAPMVGFGYKGIMAIEGNVRTNLHDDIRFSAAYLENVSKRLEWL